MKTALAACILFQLISTAAAADPEPLPWVHLADAAAQNYEDPYRDLTYDQIEALVTIAQAANEAPSERQAANLAAAQAKLAADGIDADWLISQRWVVAERRERAATAGNEAIDGELVTLTGYAIPAPRAKDGSPVAYLVPERGMCSHMPPPPPNQMVRLSLAPGQEPSWIYEPLTVTGTLRIAPTARRIMVVDGMVAMRSTYTMKVDLLHSPDREAAHKGDPMIDWARGLAERTKAGVAADTIDGETK